MWQATVYLCVACLVPQIEPAVGQAQVLNSTVPTEDEFSFKVNISTEVLCNETNGDIKERGVIVLRLGG